THCYEATAAMCRTHDRLGGRAHFANGGTMTPVLEFEQVTVKRPGKILLNRIDWHVGAGDRWVILGPNGAGKTTLLQLAGAQMHPTSGTVTVLGERLGRVDVFELRPRIGHMTTAITDRIPADEAVRDVV